MKKENSYSSYINQLGGHYLEVFQKIEVYCRAKGLDACELEECMDQLMDLFLTAQAEGKTVERIIGKDFKAFCKFYISEMFPYKMISNIFTGIIASTFAIFAAGLIISCIEYFSGDISSVWKGKWDANAILTGIILSTVISFIWNSIMKYAVFTTDTAKLKKMSILKIVTFLVMVISLSVLLDYCEIHIVLSLKTVSFASIVLFAFSFLGVAMLNSKVINNKFTANAPNQKERILAVLRKKYARINKVNIRKGKPVILAEEFVIKMKKEQKLTSWLWPLFLIIFIVELIYLVYIAVIIPKFDLFMALAIIISMIGIAVMLGVILSYKSNMKILEDWGQFSRD